MPLGNGSVFPANVTLSCSTASLPPLTTCSFTPSLVAAGQGDTNLVLKLQTTAAVPAVSSLAAPHALWYDLGLSLAGVLALGGLKPPRRRRKKNCLRLVIFGMLLTLLVACGGGSSGPGGGGGGGGGAGHPGTTPGNYTVTVNAALGSVTRSVDVVLTVQ